jgi:hypothetical protein
MSIHQFEFFHGAVLTRLVRTHAPVTLRLIETAPKESWAAYRLNDSVDLIIKHSATPRRRKTDRSARYWTFTFGAQEVADLRSRVDEALVSVALVCGDRRVAGNKVKNTMEICRLDAGQIALVLDLRSATQQQLSIEAIPRKKLVVRGNGRVIKVSRRAIDQWKIPGA